MQQGSLPQHGPGTGVSIASDAIGSHRLGTLARLLRSWATNVAVQTPCFTTCCDKQSADLLPLESIPHAPRAEIFRFAIGLFLDSGPLGPTVKARMMTLTGNAMTQCYSCGVRLYFEINLFWSVPKSGTRLGETRYKRL